MILFFALACTGGTDDTGGPQPPKLVFPWNDTATPDRPDPITLAALDALLGAAIDHVHQMDGRLAIDGFEALIGSVAQPPCPTLVENENFWDIDANGCTALKGVELLMDVRFREGELLNGEAVMADGAGSLWAMASIFTHQESTSESGVMQFESQLLGNLHVPGGTGWIGEHLSLGLRQLWVAANIGAMPIACSLDGGVGGIAEGALAAYSFDDLSLWIEVGGGPCSVEPHGSVSLHTPDGGRYSIVFDGVKPDPEGVTKTPGAGQCDGCGEAFFFGESLGEICPDISGLMDWTERPW
jgi:hypothetical protein